MATPRTTTAETIIVEPAVNGWVVHFAAEPGCFASKRYVFTDPVELGRAVAELATTGEYNRVEKDNVKEMKFPVYVPADHVAASEAGCRLPEMERAKQALARLNDKIVEEQKHLNDIITAGMRKYLNKLYTDAGVPIPGPHPSRVETEPDLENFLCEGSPIPDEPHGILQPPIDYRME